MPPSELHALTSPWPFLVWGIDIIGKISPSLPVGMSTSLWLLIVSNSALCLLYGHGILTIYENLLL